MSDPLTEGKTPGQDTDRTHAYGQLEPEFSENAQPKRSEPSNAFLIGLAAAAGLMQLGLAYGVGTYQCTHTPPAAASNPKGQFFTAERCHFLGLDRK